jgi:glyoxylase-like metal-dependent hydrolase (beta-lactamase superfamily II)/rhodanese-related sulfurtransferase
MNTARPSAVEIVAVVDEGLGHSGHLVSIGGDAIVIDPLRAVGAYESAATRNGWTIRWVADTHTHADYLSGGPELARRSAHFFAPRAAQLEVDHQGLDGGDEVDLGGLTLRALPTPGHTPDHLSYLLLDGSLPVAVFTGGSLMVGTVGRPDLLGPRHTDGLARAMWHSLHEQLLVLPDDLAAYPTHGAGSFCAAPGSDARATTIGREKRTNPLVRAATEDEFVRLLVGGLGTFPSYYGRLPELNRIGPPPLPSPDLVAVDPREVRRLQLDGAEIVDVRPVADYARTHLPGSLSNVLRPAFGSWLGWLVDPDRPLVFVVSSLTDSDELARQCAVIGYDRIAGYLDGGVDAWDAAGLPVARSEIVDARQVSGPVVDVRQANEYRAGHLPGARNVELGDLAVAPLDPGEPITVMCGHGERAATAASLLERRGGRRVTIAVGGPADWSSATGRALKAGP